jgi:tetratricopeptide (TPR) repeat protein
MSHSKEIALICTGFHRSATSATANYLHDAGLNLGENLVPGHISNAKGHFEDWDMVKLHDEQLTLSGTNLQFHDQCNLIHDSMPFKRYSQERFNHAIHWGGKDPRASLFLDEWDEVLQDSGRYLFVIRHWSCCVESLLHRHSRELAHHLPQPTPENEGLKLWLQPQLAAQMWLAYNKRILDFVKKHKSKVLLVSQRSLFEGAPILSTLNSRFGFNLNKNTTSPFQIELLRDQADVSIRNSLSCSLKHQLNTIWSELLSLADYKSQNEAPTYFEAPVLDSHLWASYQESLENNVQVSSTLAVPSIINNLETNWLTSLSLVNDPNVLIDMLNSANQTQLTGLDINKFLNLFEGGHSLNGELLLAVGKLLMRISIADLAINYFEKSITLGVYFPYVDMMLGECYHKLSKYHKALFFYDKAIKNNPRQPLFYTNKAKCLISLNRIEEAEEAFNKGLQFGSDKLECVLPYCEYLINNAKENEAKLLLVDLISSTNFSAARELLTQIELKINYKQGETRYLDFIKEKINKKDTQKWLADACYYITCPASEIDFIRRIQGHWKEVIK